MTLRLRLTLALVALATVGLTIFGVVTYSLYARSQYQRLDDQIRNSVPLVSMELSEELGPSGPGSSSGPPPSGPSSGPSRPSGNQPADLGNNDGNDDGNDGRQPKPGGRIPSGTYGELRDGNGEVDVSLVLSEAGSKPALPANLQETSSGGRFFTTGSVEGDDRWRVYAGPSDRYSRWTTVVAVPSDEVRSSLNRLVLIEVTAGLGLLAVLGAGSWLILRRGLRPLERMAQSAAMITTGDLSQRVTPSDDRTEVGQLGLALNTMLSEIESAFREREAVEAKLRQFLSDASHELRTPLTSIQGFAEMFRLVGREDVGGADVGREDGAPDLASDHVDLGVILRRIEEETARMRVLVDDLLLLARLDETRPLERQPVDLSVLAADACSDAVAADPGRPVTLDAPASIVILGDRDHLRQAIANLVTNAVRHTPPHTALEVSARAEHDVAVVVVRDRGPGLDPDALAHVFDRFWQADRARVGHGTGLGLSIVAAIAHEHGGTASAANAPDGGAVFTLRLPLGARPPGPQAVAVPSAVGTAGSGVR